MAHIVMCPYCKEKFNRDNTDFVQVSPRRYAHPECYKKFEENKTQEQKDQEALEKYILKLLNEPYLSARVKKQIKDFQAEYHYSYSGILKTLIYWYEVKNNPIEKANGGIGIVPYVYNDALNYYYALYLANLNNQDKNLQSYHHKIKSFLIEPPKKKERSIKLFDLDTIEENEVTE